MPGDWRTWRDTNGCSGRERAETRGNGGFERSVVRQVVEMPEFTAEKPCPEFPDGVRCARHEAGSRLDARSGLGSGKEPLPPGANARRRGHREGLRAKKARGRNEKRN